MQHPQPDDTVIGISAFKPRSGELIGAVASGRIPRVVLTRHGRPVAAIVPFAEEPVELWGALAELMEPPEDSDLARPTGERWKAEGG
jgi:prevent-host-death family protein